MEPYSTEQRQIMLAAIVNDSEDAIISKNLDSKVTSWNKAAERMFGYTEQEMIGESIIRLIPPERQNEEEEIISKLKQGKRIEHFETVRVTKSGRRLRISLTISPVRDASGKIIGASKIARDITRQKEYEENLQIINDLSRSINAQLDVDTILQLVTDAATRLSTAAFGAFFYNKNDTQGETYMLYALSGAPKEAFERFGTPRKTAVFAPTFEGTGIVRVDDITRDTRYGKNVPHFGMPKEHLPVVSYMAIPVISATRVVIGGLLFGHPDPGVFTAEHEKFVVAIAAQAAMALDNAKMYQDLNTLSHKKDQFLSFASHELKTPLTTLKGYLQLAQKSRMLVEDIYPRVERQLTRLEEIIADLLDISRIAAGKLVLRLSNVSLREVIAEAVDAVMTDQHIVELETLSADVDVFVDRAKMVQVLENLLTNAMKYSEKGTKITIRTAVTGNEVKISVLDEGVGIAPEHLEKIFNQFYRIQHPAAKAKGAGLGLFISREIIEAHFGKIWVESRATGGSIFNILFPITRRTA